MIKCHCLSQWDCPCCGLNHCKQLGNFSGTCAIPTNYLIKFCFLKRVQVHVQLTSITQACTCIQQRITRERKLERGLADPNTASCTVICGLSVGNIYNLHLSLLMENSFLFSLLISLSLSLQTTVITVNKITRYNTEIIIHLGFFLYLNCASCSQNKFKSISQVEMFQLTAHFTNKLYDLSSFGSPGTNTE